MTSKESAGGGAFFWFATILTAISFIYLFVFVDSKGKGKMAVIKRFIYETIPNAFKTALRKILGENAVWAIERLQSWICFEANPLIQVFYLVLAVGGYYLYVVYGFQHVPNPYVDNYHKYVAWPFMASCYWSYYKACFTNPGRLNKSLPKPDLERAVKRYGYD